MWLKNDAKKSDLHVSQVNMMKYYEKLIDNPHE